MDQDPRVLAGDRQRAGTKRVLRAMVKRIHRLIPYDQARVYFVDDSGKISDEFLVGVDQIPICMAGKK